MPLTLIAAITIAALVAGIRGAAAATVFVPAAGFAALAWHERASAFREDARLFVRVLARRDHRARLIEERARLAAEFDRIVEETARQPTDASEAVGLG